MKRLYALFAVSVYALAANSIAAIGEDADVQCGATATALAFLEPVEVSGFVLNEEVIARKRLALAKHGFILPLNGRRLEEDLVLPSPINMTIPAKTEFPLFAQGPNDPGINRCTFVRVKKKRRFACLHDENEDGTYETASVDMKQKSGIARAELTTSPKTKSMDEVYKVEQELHDLQIGTPYLESWLEVSKVKKKQLELSLYAGVAFHHRPQAKRKKDRNLIFTADRVEKLKIKAKNLNGPVQIGNFILNIRRTDDGTWYVRTSGDFGELKPKLHCGNSAASLAKAYVQLGSFSIRAKSGVRVQNYDFWSDRYTSDAVISF